MLKTNGESHDPHVFETIPAQYKKKRKKRRPYREHECGTGQLSSKGQVRELLQL